MSAIEVADLVGVFRACVTSFQTSEDVIERGRPCSLGFLDPRLQARRTDLRETSYFSINCSTVAPAARSSRILHLIFKGISFPRVILENQEIKNKSSLKFHLFNESVPSSQME